MCREEAVAGCKQGLKRFTLRNNFMFFSPLSRKQSFHERCLHAFRQRRSKTRSLHQYGMKCDIKNKGGGGGGQSCSDMAADGKFLGGSVTGQQKARDNISSRGCTSKGNAALAKATCLRAGHRGKRPGFRKEKESQY